MEVVHDDTAHPEILWTFHSRQPVIDDKLSQRLGPGIDRGRITLYSGVDCNRFFPTLYDIWSALEPDTRPESPTRSNPVHVTTALAETIEAKLTYQIVLEGDDEDRPPLIEICVGRDEELQKLRESQAKVVFITGFGGQGKSTLAAKYYSDCQNEVSHFSLLVWRDCKEEGERFETQLVAIIERLSEGRISGKDLAQQSVESVIEILLNQLHGINVLCIFDNVDHYVDMEKQQMLGSTDIFIATLLKSTSNSRVVFTCRPLIEYGASATLSIRLSGIDLEATRSLFSARKAASTPTDIAAAHRVTNGHAFWLDLLASQVAQRISGRGLNSLLSEIRAGGGLLPTTTLNSIWSTLKDRERAVLRVMTETVKPESEVSIADYLSSKLTISKVAKALRTLRSLNLIVIKQRPRGLDLLELHPLVRSFIRQSFPKPERTSYIIGIIRVYKGVRNKYKPRLAQAPPLSILQY
jgi:hypothetical protein